MERLLLIGASFFAAMAAECAGAALGFGPAIVYEVSWELCALLGLADGELESAVSNLGFIEVPCALVQMAMLRRHFRPKLWALLNLPLAAGVPLGTMMLITFGHADWIKRLLGLLFLLVAAQQAQAGKAGPPAARPDLEGQGRLASLAIVLTFLASGFFRGFLGVAGPPVMVLLRFFSVDRTVWRCISSSGRLTMVATQGSLLGSQLRPESWPLYLCLAVGGLTGFSLGNFLAPFVDATLYERWLQLFLAAGAVLMLCSGHRTLSLVASVAVVLSALAMICPSLVCLCRRVHVGSLLPSWCSGTTDFSALRPLVMSRQSSSGSTGQEMKDDDSDVAEPDESALLWVDHAPRKVFSPQSSPLFSLMPEQSPARQPTLSRCSSGSSSHSSTHGSERDTKPTLGLPPV